MNQKNQKRAVRLKGQNSTGFSLLEMLLSLALFALVLMLSITIGTQAVRAWSELEEEEIVITEGNTLLQMIARDLSSSFLEENPSANIPHVHSQKNIFFLMRNPSDDLVAVGYFLDPQIRGHCYRFFANERETLEARSKGGLLELYESAAPGEIHCELVASHLLSLEITPVWKNEDYVTPVPPVVDGKPTPPPSLLEIETVFGQKKRHYSLSTVVALSSAR